VALREEYETAKGAHRWMNPNSIRLSGMRVIRAGSGLLLDAAGSIEHRSWLVVMSLAEFFRCPLFVGGLVVLQRHCI
jgi:hypothetical protein